MYSNGIRKLESDQVLSISSTASSDDAHVLKLHFFGFRLDSFLTHLIAFDVVRTQSWDINSTIPFDQVLVNEGGGWNSETNEFTPPIEGNYFLSFSVGVPSQPVFTTVSLNLNSYAIMEADIDFPFAWSQPNASYPDVVSWSLVYPLLITCRVTVVLYNGGIFSDPHNFQTSFRGFYYSPSFFPSAVWYLLGGGMFLDLCQPQPINFAIVVKANVQLLGAGKYLQIQVPGIYMVMMNSNSMTGANYGLRLQLNLNGSSTLLAVRYDLGKDNVTVGGISRSGSAIISLRSGDQLMVSQANKSCISFSIMTTFGGILLLPS